MISKISSEIRICLICLSVLCLIQCNGQLSFYKNNSCGCFLDYYCSDNCETCTISKPKCSTQNLKFEAFEPDNLDNCNEWYLEGYRIKDLNIFNGTITVKLLFSPKHLDTKYKIDLKIFDNSTQTVILHNHSTKYINIKNGSTCNSTLPVEFNFLFNGTYQLEIFRNEEGISKSMKCRSKPFIISSMYQERKLNDLEPYYNSRYRPQEQELVLNSYFGNFSAGHHPYATVVKLKSHIDVSLRDCAGSGNEVAKYILHGKNGPCCDCYDESATNGKCGQQTKCPCIWHRNEEELTCTFHNVSNGDYCIVVQFYDPRCASDTIWTKNGSCAWSYNETARGVKTDDTIRLEKKFSNWIISIPFIFIGAIVIISFVLYKYKSKCFQKLTHGLNNYAPSNLIQQSSETSAMSWIMRDECEKFIIPEILLLYPRDCEPFMKAMAVFRSYLKSVNFKVYDPWDEQIYDDVVESYETWTLSFIKNKNVKIVIVLTECSKKFEKAFLENYILEYAEPQALDTVFTQSLSTIHQYFAKRFDSYQRLFVICVDGSPTTNFDFITPATIYSLPKNTGLLISDLTSGNLKEIKSYNYTNVIGAFDEYESFANANRDYLTDLLCPKTLYAT